MKTRYRSASEALAAEKAEASKHNWRYVIVTDPSEWCEGVNREKHWAVEKVGHEIRVSIEPSGAENSVCECRLFMLHPDDKAKLKGPSRDWPMGLDVAECQFSEKKAGRA